MISIGNDRRVSPSVVIVMLVILASAMAGCGGGSATGGTGPAGVSGVNPAPATGSISVETSSLTTRAAGKAGIGEVTALRFSGRDAAGQSRYGPVVKSLNDANLTRVPLGVVQLTVETLSGNEVTGVYNHRIRVLPNGTVSIKDPAAPTAALKSITLTPSASQLPRGISQAFVAMGTFADKSTYDITSAVKWESSSPAVASISNADGSKGQVKGLALGTTTITATCTVKPYSPGKIPNTPGTTRTASTTLDVTPAVLTGLQVSTARASLPRGLSQILTATGIFSDDSKEDLSAVVSWSSSDTQVAAFSTAGVSNELTAANVGSATISASLNGKSGTFGFTVTEPVLTTIQVESRTVDLKTLPKGLVEKFTATGVYTDHTTRDLTASATWTSSNPVAAVINGLDADRTSIDVFGYDVGSADISATLSGVVGAFRLEVTPAILTSMAVTPLNVELSKGLTTQFVAEGYYSDGSQPRNLTELVTWTTSPIGIVDVSNTPGSKGLARAAAEGLTTVYASLAEGTENPKPLSAFTTFNVTAAKLTELRVSPSELTVNLGQEEPLFTVQGTYTDGTTPDLTGQVVWSSSDTAVATVLNDGSGKAIPQGAGTTTITARLDGVEGTATLTVKHAVLQSISITSADGLLQVPAGLSKQLTATGAYSDGTERPLTDAVSWSSSDPTILAVSSTGLASGRKTGTVTVTATVEGTDVVGSTSFAVTPALLTGITVTTTDSWRPFPIVWMGDGYRFAANGMFTDGTTQDITKSCTWTSSNVGVAYFNNVSSLGVAFTVNTGTVQVTATRDSVSGSSPLYVVPRVELSRGVLSGKEPVRIALPEGSQPEVVAVGDLDEDGNQDILAGCRGNGTIALVFGNGATGVKRTDTIAVGRGQYSTGGYVPAPFNVAVADLNGDRHLDIVTDTSQDAMYQGYQNRRLVVFMGDGSGGFTRMPDQSIFLPVGTTLVIKVADLNLDGKPDIVTHDYGRFRLFTNRTPLGAVYPTFTQVEAVAPSVYLADVGNLDDDPFPEIVTLESLNCRVNVYDNQTSIGGDPSPVKTGTFDAWVKGAGFISYARIADANADGRQDVIVMPYFYDYASGVSVLYGRGDRTFEPYRTFSGIQRQNSPHTPALADFNLDGWVDIVGPLGSGIACWVGNGLGDFGSYPTWVFQPKVYETQHTQRAVEAADFDNDNKPDVVSTQYHSTYKTASIFIYRNWKP